jgi:hypothetical protein
MRLLPLSLVAMLAPGCVSARWTVTEQRALPMVAVGPAQVSGACDLKLVQTRREALIESLRKRGYEVFEGDDTRAMAHVTLTVKGTIIDDSQMHAPDDARHHIVNDLHYQFVSYRVAVTVVDHDGAMLAQGSAEADRDPGPALRVLALKMFEDTPPTQPANRAVAAR